MPKGICVMYKDGDPYAVNVDYGNDFENQIDIELYEQKGIQPPWKNLKPCPGTPIISHEIDPTK